ncbi:MAG TPA: SMI1/KNR4 family protein [Cyanobacteria bacterium UBA8553]|nr:SMI1/KNR4 family protein [Cyanobacteria bacterium UBA8553]HAJ61979.1 SMI1/KNR4 family protein [Cyanobacteria bacterium UBA8543]
MNTFNWERFLKRWSQELLDSMDEERSKLPPEVIRSAWFGYPGATDEQIARAEARLETTLPSSYREFLKVTNGWRQTTPFIYKLWSTEDIEWLWVRHQAWIDAFLYPYKNNDIDSLDSQWETPSISNSDYFVYGDAQDCSTLRVEYLQTALEISEKGESAIYLLNPQVVAEDGEWEAWFFCDWLPGADRYRSFREMMEVEYENFLELRET